MRWAARSAAVLALAAAALAAAGCRTAAVVFFDLPPEWATPDSVGRAARDSARARAERAWPAVEQARDEEAVLAILPRDANGHVDWVAAERDSLIRPRWGPDGAGAPPGAGWSHEVVFETGTTFPHGGHTEWIACEACHQDFGDLRAPALQSPLEHAGECAACHGPVAFPVQSCGRCHPGRAGEGSRRMELLPGDLRMARSGATDETRTYGVTDNPRARFRHWIHRARYRCTACHPEPFPMVAGETYVTHRQIERGEACGRCHDDRTAFGLASCDRCHAVDPADSRRAVESGTAAPAMSGSGDAR